MDKFLNPLTTGMVRRTNKMHAVPSTSGTSQTKDKPAKGKSATRSMVAQTSSQKDGSPALETSPGSIQCSPSSPAQEETPSSEQIQAAVVAQEVSHLLIPIFDKRLEALHSSINNAISLISANTQRLGEAESRISSCEDNITGLQTSVTNQEARSQQLLDRLEDLENRNRRNNLRFVGIPETVKGEDLTTFLAIDLMETLKLSTEHVMPPIERAHRLGREDAYRRDRPRPTVARFFHFLTKERILQAYRKEGPPVVRGHRILVFQDFSASVSRKRKAFSEVCKHLVDNNIRFQLQYPAKLKVTTNGRAVIFEDPIAARNHFIPND